MKKSVQEVLALPEWERYCWRVLFDYHGPLDWRRQDYLTARINQYQSTGDGALGDYVLFKEPKERFKTREEKETELLAQLGWGDG